MTLKTKNKRRLTEEEIDEIVERQAEDDSAWEPPIHIKQKDRDAVAIPHSLAARAAFIARLHRQPSVEEWLTNIILERVEIEETAFAGIKRNMKRNISAKASAPSA